MRASGFHFFSIHILQALVKQFFPKPQYSNCTNNAEDEIREIALAKQFDVQQVADEGSYIAVDMAGSLGRKSIIILLNYVAKIQIIERFSLPLYSLLK